MPHRTAAPPDGTPATWPAPVVHLSHAAWWRRPPARAAWVMFILGNALTLLAVHNQWMDELPVVAWALLTTWGVTTAVLGVAWRAGMRPPASVVFSGDGVFIPRWSTSDGARLVRFSEVRDVQVITRRWKRAELRVTTERHAVHVEAGQLSPAEAAWVLAHIMDGVRRSGGRVAAVEARSSAAAVILSRRAWVVSAVAGVCVAVNAAILASDAGRKPLGALVYGAHARALLLEGQWFRFFTGTYVHREAWHLWGNLVVLVPLGVLLERSVGGARVLFLVTVAGMASALATNAGAHVAGMGVSGVVFAVMAATVLLLLRQRDALPGRTGMRAWRLAVLITLVMVMETVGGGELDVPGMRIDHGAHAAGLLVGILFGLSWRPRHVGSAAPVPRPLLAWNAALVAVHALAALTCAQDDTPLAALARRSVLGAVDDNTEEVEQLNQAAWFTALDPAAPPEDLARAETLARRLVARSPLAPHLDTLATVLARRGAMDEAMELQWRSFAATGPARAFYASQLARLGERSRERGDMRALEGHVKLVIRVTPAEEPADEDAVDLEVLGLPADGVMRAVVAVQEQRVVLVCADGAGAVPVESPGAAAVFRRAVERGTAEMDVVLVLRPTTGAEEACGDGVLVFPRDPATREIP